MLRFTMRGISLVMRGGGVRPNLSMTRPPHNVRRYTDIGVVNNNSPARFIDYFSNAERCVFSKDVKPWHKFVCGTLGITAGFAGIIAGASE
jgi:hypothetical protein